MSECKPTKCPCAEQGVDGTEAHGAIAGWIYFNQAYNPIIAVCTNHLDNYMRWAGTSTGGYEDWIMAYEPKLAIKKKDRKYNESR